MRQLVSEVPNVKLWQPTRQSEVETVNKPQPSSRDFLESPQRWVSLLHSNQGDCDPAISHQCWFLVPVFTFKLESEERRALWRPWRQVWSAIRHFCSVLLEVGAKPTTAGGLGCHWLFTHHLWYTGEHPWPKNLNSKVLQNPKLFEYQCDTETVLDSKTCQIFQIFRWGILSEWCLWNTSDSRHFGEGMLNLYSGNWSLTSNLKCIYTYALFKYT